MVGRAHALLDSYIIMTEQYVPSDPLPNALLVAALGQGRSRASGTSAELVLLALSGISVMFFDDSTARFEWRYALSLVVILPAAATLAVEMLQSAGRAGRTTGAGRNGAGRAAPSPTQAAGRHWPLGAVARRPWG